MLDVADLADQVGRVPQGRCTAAAGENEFGLRGFGADQLQHLVLLKQSGLDGSDGFVEDDQVVLPPGQQASRQVQAAPGFGQVLRRDAETEDALDRIEARQAGNEEIDEPGEPLLDQMALEIVRTAFVEIDDGRPESGPAARMVRPSAAVVLPLPSPV